MSKSLRSIVTGGAGFIGTHLVRELLAQGDEVLILDLKKSTLEHPRLKTKIADVSNLELLRESWVDCDRAFHLAAQVSVPLCQERPLDSTQVNFLATQNVCEVMVEKSPKATMVFASSSAVYGHQGKRGIPIQETDPLAPFSFYAFHKLWCEQLIQMYRQEKGLRGICLRLFNVYGSGQDKTSPYSGVISQFLHRLETGEELMLFNEGKNTRDFVHVSDVVRCFKEASQISSASTSLFNVGSGRMLTVRELAEVMSEAARKKWNRSSVIRGGPPRSGDVLHSLADISKAQAELKFQPQVSLMQGLEGLFSSLK